MKHSTYLFVLVAVLTLASCGAVKLAPFDQTPLGQSPDYAIKESWAVLPGAYPSALSEVVGEYVTKAADVFFIYPTLFSDKKLSIPFFLVSQNSVSSLFLQMNLLTPKKHFKIELSVLKL